MSKLPSPEAQDTTPRRAVRTQRRKTRPSAGPVVTIVTAPAVPTLGPGQALRANLSLALLLLGIVGGWFYLAPPNPIYQLGYALLALTTVALAGVALARPPARHADERWWVYVLCMMSICYALGYRFDPRQGDYLAMIFWGRVALQLLANLWMLSLGQSYGMLPALRQVRTSLLYRYVRHPAYAMYLLADLGVVALQPSPWNAGVALIGATVFLLRARLEEGVLAHDPAYADYMGRVRWRFFPGVH